jgi:hypothetical protein
MIFMPAEAATQVLSKESQAIHLIQDFSHGEATIDSNTCG